MKNSVVAFGFVVVTILVLAMLVTPALAITWGEPDSDNKYPNVGAMIVHVVGDGYFAIICSGTLIDSRVFLTAGHCTDYYYTLLAGDVIDDVYVSFDYDPSAATLKDVQQVITHPDYNGFRPRSDPHDMGLLILEDPVTNIKPAQLPNVGFLDELKAGGVLRQGSNGAKFTVVGYGVGLQWPPPVFTPNNARQFAESEYQALLPAWLRMSQNHATDNGGTCYGDSGGPAFYLWTKPDGTKIEVLVGITSWGDVPCVATGFNYRTDIPQTLSFINDNQPP